MHFSRVQALRAAASLLLVNARRMNVMMMRQDARIVPRTEQLQP